MAKLTSKCPKCGKIASVESDYVMGPKRVYKLACGHFMISEASLATLKTDDGFASVNGDFNAYDYQRSGVEFIEGTDYNAILADAVGLGKTMQAFLAFRRNRAALRPCIVTCPSSLIYQWYAEYERWVNAGVPYLVFNGAAPVVPGFDCYIISHDLLAKKGMIQKLSALAPKLLIVDEIHKFKEDESKRTIALFKLVRDAGIKHKILLSGTPIKNRANEYFNPLNLLAPEHFPFRRKFEWEWLVTDGKGIPSRIAPWKLDRFRALTAQWVLRREKRDVLKDLPPLSRNKVMINLSVPEEIRIAYNKELDELEALLSSGRFTAIEGLGRLSKLRRLEGIAKVKDCIDRVIDFLESTEDEKIAIGIHHQDVRDLLFAGLAAYRPLKLSGEDSPARKDWVKNEFNENPERRVLICNILAGGLGLNLQSCANCIILERQWNFVDETQFEGRFHRNGQTQAVVSDYLIGKNFVDDYFTAMVEMKRGIYLETMDAQDDAAGYDLSADEGGIKDLCETVVKGRI